VSTEPYCDVKVIVGLVRYWWAWHGIVIGSCFVGMVRYCNGLLFVGMVLNCDGGLFCGHGTVLW
jgi:hypothetical protein